jgi:hypothetical protein
LPAGLVPLTVLLHDPRYLRAGAALFAGFLVAGAIAVGSSAARGVEIHAGAGGGVSGAPTGLSGTAGVDSASISFTPGAPSTPPVTSYTVTAYPGHEQGFGATSPVTVSGLQPNTAYTFAVSAASAAGRSSGSAPSAPLTTLAAPAGVTLPALSALRLSLVSFFAAASGGPVSGGTRTGTDVSYADSVAATSTIVVLRVRSGVQHAGACVITGSSAGKRCTSLLLVGSFTNADVAGTNKFHFSGRVGGHALHAGLYQVRITPSLDGLAGNTLMGEFDVF